MSEIIQITNCPVCNSNNIKDVFSVIDHSVSNETFVIAECNNCHLRFTKTIPDKNNISRYYKSEDYISHTDSSTGLFNRLYQFARRRTLHHKRILIKKITGLQKGQLLDIGSGTGAFVDEMKRHHWQVTGLEPDADAKAVAKRKYNIDLKDSDILFQLPALSFDVITLWHVLEHVHDLNKYIIQLKKILKDKGMLFIAVPNYTSHDAEIYKEYWAAYDVPRHLYHFSPHSMKVLIEKHGLKLLDCKPMWYDSFYISMLSSKYKNGKKNIFSSSFNGLFSNMKAISNVKRCSSVIYIVSK